MKKRISGRLLLAGSSLLLSALAIFPAFAANPAGYLDSVSDSKITGWAWDQDDPSAHVTVELTLSDANGPGSASVVTVTADQDREDLKAAIGSADHSFSYDIDWASYSGDTITVIGTIVSGDTRTPLLDSITYNKKENTSVRNELTAPAEEETGKEPPTAADDSDDFGPGNPNGTASADNGDNENPSKAKNGEEASSNDSSIIKVGETDGPKETDQKPEAAETSVETGVQGEFLGTFRASGYCTCTKCTKGSGRTYSGTFPKANHTIAADLKVFPLGTKLMIDGVVYTVEDMGGGINGDRLDIYFGSHSDALAYGFKNVKVYAVK